MKSAPPAPIKATAMRQVPSPFDLVLTTNSGYPLDQNLYQAVKGMSAAAKIVKPAARSSAPPNVATVFRRMADQGRRAGQDRRPPSRGDSRRPLHAD
jgi:hypothetical protein